MIFDAVIHNIITFAAQNDDIEAIWLYGSRTQNSATQHSDYDIAIAFKNFKLSPTNKLLRPNELAIDWAEQLSMNTDLISVVDINTIPIYLAFNVIEYGEVIYSTKSNRVYKEMDRIRSRYEFELKESKNNDKYRA